MKMNRYLLTISIGIFIVTISLWANWGWAQAAGRQTAVYQPDTTFDQLLETAVQQGVVPVIIGLEVPDYDMAQIANGEQRAVDTQLTAINQAQQRVQDGLVNDTVSNVKQFKHIPFMALWTD